MEALERGPVERNPLALVVGGVGAADVGALVPGEPEPAQVLEHGPREIHPVARGVEVVVPQDQGPAGLLGPPGGDPERARVAQVQVAGRGGREAPAVWGRGFQGFLFNSGPGTPSWHPQNRWQSSYAFIAARPGTSSAGTILPPRRSEGPWSRTDGASSTAAAMSG